MRDWFWRAILCMGAACGPDVSWVLPPPDPDPQAVDASRPAPDAAASSAPPHDQVPARWAARRPGIACECEAFAAGRYPGLLLESRQTPPPWAWINPLAHADLGELRRLADLSPGRHEPLALLSYLADEVLLRVSRGDTNLQQLQIDILAPLEQALLHQPPSTGFTDLAKIVVNQLNATPTLQPG